MIHKYDFYERIQKLNTLLRKKKPQTFNPSWIKTHANSLYKYLCKNVQVETGDVDWDLVTVGLDRTFQKRWKRFEKKEKSIPYEDKKELNLITAKYHNKLYTLMAPIDKQDRQIQDQIMIRLVRTAQKGNLLAKQQVMECMTFIIYEWIENSVYIARWKGYPDGIKKNIEACISNYRYSGTFISYVFRTFQYSARGLRSTYSFDERFSRGIRNNSIV